jgi:hypothetical protein
MGSILQPYALERPETHPDLGTLFLSFLSRYGTQFDTRKHAVVLSINGPFVPLSSSAAYAHVPRVGTPNYWKPAEPVVVTGMGLSLFLSLSDLSICVSRSSELTEQSRKVMLWIPTDSNRI